MPRTPSADIPIKGSTLRGASITHTPKINVIPATTSFAINIILPFHPHQTCYFAYVI
jgi:hypothetical protein